MGKREKRFSQTIVRRPRLALDAKLAYNRVTMRFLEVSA